MFCTNCGTKLPDGSTACPHCSADRSNDAVAPAHNEGQKVSPNITLCPDGIYRWFFEFNLFKNPTVLFVVWKVLFLSFVGVWLMLVLLEGFSDGFSFSTLLDLTVVFGGLILGMLLLGGLAYLLYALFLGGRYCVLFEMDAHGVKHVQMQPQFKRAQALAWIVALSGLAAGKPGVAGTGILAATKNSMYSSFEKVRSVEVLRKRNVIKVNEMLSKNQIYAEDEDFDFVCDFIRRHVPEKIAKTI